MENIKLPEIEVNKISVEEALKRRKSTRDYKDEKLTIKEISQLLWACDGKNSNGRRTSPSAGATYPLEIFLIAGEIEKIEKGLYHYNFGEHSISLIKKGDLRNEISKSAYEQRCLKIAPAIVVISGIFERTTGRYGERGKRYVYMEVGHCGQNLHLQAEALSLGIVMVGAFDDEKVKGVLGIGEDVFYLCPVGKKNE